MDGPVTVARLARGALLALAFTVSPETGRATCSPAALDAVRTELRAGTLPSCGTKAVRRAFKRARRKASKVVLRAAAPCAAVYDASTSLPRMYSPLVFTTVDWPKFLLCQGSRNLPPLIVEAGNLDSFSRFLEELLV